MIVTSANLWPNYGKVVHDSMVQVVSTFLSRYMNDDEESKSLQTVMSLYDRLMENELDRSSGIVAVGGGVVGDVAGFAAATFMRGIRVHPSAHDVACASGQQHRRKDRSQPSAGKNLIGAFHQPTLVWTDVSTLRTLIRERTSLWPGRSDKVRNHRRSRTR